MKSRTIRFLFGRLNVTAPGRRKVEVFGNVFKQNTLIRIKKHHWGFFDVKLLESPIGNVYQGFLVKFKPQTVEEVANPETHSLQDAIIANRVVAKSRFFLQVQTGVIAYHPAAGDIPPEVFRHRFADVFEGALDNFFVQSEILSIEEEQRLLATLRRFRRVQRLTIYLHPSNPDNRDLWRGVDERLRARKAAAYNEEFEAAPGSDGLMIQDDQEIISKIAMAEDGYGRAAASGELEGEDRLVSTHDNPVSSRAPLDEEPPEVVFERLSLTFSRILERFIDEQSEDR